MMTFLMLVSTLLAQDPSPTALRAKDDLHNLVRALDMHYTDCGFYPKQLEGVIKNSENCGVRWGPEPYIKEIPQDPWGRPYIYRSNWQDDFELLTLGADGREGGEGEEMDFRAER